jgi:uncharacterized protein YdhG (YjbR/CyaY superfamily)
MRWHTLAAWILTGVLGLPMLVPCTAQAGGSRFDVEFSGGPQGHIRERARIWISDRKLRIEQYTPGLKRSKHVLIYRGDQDRFYSLNPERKTYVRVEREMIAAFGFEMKAARVEVDATLRRLPEDQHKMFERLIGAKESGEAVVKTPVMVVKKDARLRMGKYVCRIMELVRDDIRIGETCVVPWKQVGVTQPDLEVFRTLANFQRELMGARDLTPLEIVPNQRLDLIVQFGGFPLYLKRTNGGKDESLIKVLEIKPLKRADAMFMVPKDYVPVSPLTLLVGNVPEAPAPAKPSSSKK